MKRKITDDSLEKSKRIYYDTVDNIEKRRNSEITLNTNLLTESKISRPYFMNKRLLESFIDKYILFKYPETCVYRLRWRTRIKKFHDFRICLE